MNVLLLADNPAFGGTSRYCMNLALGLRQLGLEVSILAPFRTDRPQDDWLLQEGQNNHVPVRTLRRRGPFDWELVAELRQILRDGQTDIIHSQGYLSNVLARLAIQTGRLRTRSIVTFHAWTLDRQSPRRSRVYMWLDVLTTRWSAHAIAVDSSVKRDYAQRRVPAGMITVIPNGVKLWEANGAASPRTSDRFVVGFVGRMSYEKGITPLVNIIQRLLPDHPDIEFLVVGDGPEKGQLEALQSEPYGSRLTLTGRVVDVNPYYEQMDVLIMPSLREAMPFTVLEVMAHGVPVIATRVGGLPGVIDHEQNGILVQPQDEADMLHWLLQLKADPALRLSLGAQAGKTIEEQYSIQVMSRKTLQVYEGVLA